VGLIIRMV